MSRVYTARVTLRFLPGELAELVRAQQRSAAPEKGFGFWARNVLLHASRTVAIARVGPGSVGPVTAGQTKGRVLPRRGVPKQPRVKDRFELIEVDDD